MKEILLKQGSTWFLRGAIIFLGLGILALCIFAFPTMSKSMLIEFPNLIYPWQLILTGMYATVVPFFFALYQGLKLLNYIDQNKAFSDLSVRALKYIKSSAITMGVIYVMGMPLFFSIANADDAPGVVIVGMIITCAPLVIAVFAAILQKLVQNAIDMKSENDLTV